MGEDWLTRHLTECDAADHLWCAEQEIGRKVTAMVELHTKNERLRAALDRASGRLGHLSTVLSIFGRPLNAKDALAWSEEARAALAE